jgi:hypothetical protein
MNPRSKLSNGLLLAITSDQPVGTVDLSMTFVRIATFYLPSILARSLSGLPVPKVTSIDAPVKFAVTS